MPNPRPNFGGYRLDFSSTTATLREVFGDQPLTPAEATKRLWAFIKANNVARQVPR